MTPTQLYYSDKHTRDEIKALCKDAGTSYDNFKQIAVSGGSVGKALAERLAVASGGSMTELEILYPERYIQNSP